MYILYYLRERFNMLKFIQMVKITQEVRDFCMFHEDTLKKYDLEVRVTKRPASLWKVPNGSEEAVIPFITDMTWKPDATLIDINTLNISYAGVIEIAKAKGQKPHEFLRKLLREFALKLHCGRAFMFSPEHYVVR